MRNPIISVIIPTLNRAEPLRNVLRYFLTKETYREFEIIIIDQSDSEDRYVQELVATSNTPIVYEHVEFRQTTRARNRGVQLARGELVVFSEDDVEPHPGLLNTYISALAQDDVHGATGPVLLPGQSIRSLSELSEKEITALRTMKTMRFDVDFEFDAMFAAGGNSAYRRAGIFAVGGFDENYVGNAWGEELEFSYRIRTQLGRIKYCPQACVLHRVNSTGGSRSAKPPAYVRDFTRNSIYTDRRTAVPMLGKIITVWRCFRRLIANRTNLFNGATLKLLPHFLAGVHAGLTVRPKPFPLTQ
jgi:GT2 family glycosyltransferase